MEDDLATQQRHWLDQAEVKLQARVLIRGQLALRSHSARAVWTMRTFSICVDAAREFELRHVDADGGDLHTLAWSQIRMWRVIDDQRYISFTCFNPADSIELKAQSDQDLQRWKRAVLKLGLTEDSSVMVGEAPTPTTVGGGFKVQRAKSLNTMCFRAVDEG